MGETKERDWACLLDKVLGTAADNPKPIDWPFRPGVKVGLRLLSDAEIEACELAANEYVTTHKFGAGQLAAWLSGEHKAMHSARYSREVLRLALVDPDSGQPLITTLADISRRHRSEIDVLMREYSDYSEEMAPLPTQVEDEAEFERLADSLRGPFDEAVLNRCAPSTLRRFAHYLTNNWKPRKDKAAGATDRG